MKKLILFTSLISSLSTHALDSISGSYKVADENCNIIFISKNGAIISEKLEKDTELNIEAVGGKVNSSNYEGYSILGGIIPGYSKDKSFNKKYEKNTTIKLDSKSESIIFTQDTKPFNYYYSVELCNPYDITGTSCIVGLLNPLNWAVKKAKFHGITFQTIISKEVNGDLQYSRFLVEENERTLTHGCKLTR